MMKKAKYLAVACALIGSAPFGFDAVAQQHMPNGMVGYWCGDNGAEAEIKTEAFFLGLEGEPASCQVHAIRKHAIWTAVRATCQIEEHTRDISTFRMSLRQNRLTVGSRWSNQDWRYSVYRRCAPRSNTPTTAAVFFEIRMGTDFPDGDLHNFRNVSQAQCEASCSGDDRCVGYSYVEPTKWCWLKSRLYEDRRDRAVVSAVKKPAAIPVMAMQVPQLETKDGVDFPGGDYNHYPRVSRDRCESICTNDERCVGYSYVPDANSCWLKSSLSSPRLDDAVVSGVKKVNQ